jgi:hypothetical protein
MRPKNGKQLIRRKAPHSAPQIARHANTHPSRDARKEDGRNPESGKVCLTALVWQERFEILVIGFH